MHADGSHKIIYDKEKKLPIEYFDKDGKIISQVVPTNQDMSDVGMAGALGKILGKERAAELLGSSLTNADLYDTQTLKDVLKLSDQEIARIQRNGSLKGVNLSDSQIFSLAGEALMKKDNAYYTDSWQNTGNIGLTLVNGLINGNIMAEVNAQGGYDYSTVNAIVYRDPDSYKSWSESGMNPTYNKLDMIEFVKSDLKGKVIASTMFGEIQTIDNMTTNRNKDNLDQRYTDPVHGVIQGNTIVAGKFNMQYYSSSTSYTGNVLVINNAYTMNGTWVNSRGKGGLDNNRWLLHANRTAGELEDWFNVSSDGCFIPGYNQTVNILNKLNSRGVQSGYQISTQLLDQRYTPYNKPLGRRY